jgi:hypothetical protein
MRRLGKGAQELRGPVEQEGTKMNGAGNWQLATGNRQPATRI